MCQRGVRLLQGGRGVRPAVRLCGSRIETGGVHLEAADAHLLQVAHQGLQALENTSLLAAGRSQRTLYRAIPDDDTPATGPGHDMGISNSIGLNQAGKRVVINGDSAGRPGCPLLKAFY